MVLDVAIQGVSTLLNVAAALVLLMRGQQRRNDVVMVVERSCSRGRNESYVACDIQFHDDVLALSLMKGSFQTFLLPWRQAPVICMAQQCAVISSTLWEYEDFQDG